MTFKNTFRSIPICLTLVAALALIAVPGCARASADPDSESTENSERSEDSKILYALGLAMAQNLGQFTLTADELASVTQGLEDSVLGNEPKVDLQEYGPKLQGFAQKRMLVAAEVEKADADAFLATEAAKEGAVKTDSGLILTTITAGDGASPTATDTVKVHYHGTLRDGSVFDSSVDRGEPVTFPLNQVIPCWTEGVQTMKVGDKSRLVCPSSIAYGDQGRPPTIPGGAALVFEVELLGIESSEASGASEDEGAAEGGGDGSDG